MEPHEIAKSRILSPAHLPIPPQRRCLIRGAPERFTAAGIRANEKLASYGVKGLLNTCFFDPARRKNGLTAIHITVHSSGENNY
jgi:hypothetical protein